jgi:hypothetical protein
VQWFSGSVSARSITGDASLFYRRNHLFLGNFQKQNAMTFGVESLEDRMMTTEYLNFGGTSF